MPSPAEDRHRQEDACKYGSVWVAEVCACACGAHPNRVDAIAEVRIARREDGQRHLIEDRLALVALVGLGDLPPAAPQVPGLPPLRLIVVDKQGAVVNDARLEVRALGQRLAAPDPALWP